RKDKIPTNLTEIEKALEKIFGPGAFQDKKLIVKRLYEKLGFKFEEKENWDFLEYMNKIRKQLLLERE
ncbi:hypothetical protein DRO59_07500, partial [Candidatus Bathyarchaeota archaeon]